MQKRKVNFESGRFEVIDSPQFSKHTADTQKILQVITETPGLSMGISPMLDKLNIPKSTAYWWMDKYEISIGVKSVHYSSVVEEVGNDEGTFRVVGEGKQRRAMARGKSGVIPALLSTCSQNAEQL